MAKELPYFRFTPSEWQNGKISLEDNELQGFFIQVICYYWICDCSITVAMLKKRYKRDIALLNSLIELEIISVDENDEFIVIKFLNEQYDLLSQSRKRRQDAGSKGGNKRSSNVQAMLQQTLSYKDNDNNKDKDNDSLMCNFDIEEVYNSYPIKCFVKNTSTGKSVKDKEKIKSLLKKSTKEVLIKTIEKYVLECKTGNRFMKNFSTFLNNLPDYSEVKPSMSDNDRICFFKSEMSIEKIETKGTYSRYLRELKDWGEEKVKFLRFE